jgi:clan AA aspartic protease
MVLVYAELELVNSVDFSMHQRGFIKETEIRREKVRALVDSGAYMMCINENLKNQLGLDHRSFETAQMADGTLRKVEIVGPVDVHFLNRITGCYAMVMPGESEVLLGSIPMEDLDVIIDPRLQTLALPPGRPYMAQKSAK